MNSKNSTLITIILSGFFAIVGTIAGGLIKGKWDVKLAEQKYQADLVLKALESSSATERLETLKMLVHTNLIKESDIRDGVDKYIIEKQKNPSTIPQVIPSSSPEINAPIISNARIYLLTGSKNKVEKFEALQNELTTAGFTVVGARYLIDRERKDKPEIRYFNSTDKDQADKIAEFMQLKFSDKNYSANEYKDIRVKQGYIEIWLGR